MARTYKRDARGRFSGGGGVNKRKASGGTLAARASLKSSRSKLATKQTSAQKGAVTRGSRRLAAAQAANRQALLARKSSGVIKGKVKRDPSAMAKASKSKPPANKISRTGRLSGTRKTPANAIRRGPKSPDTRLDRALRDMDRTIKDVGPKLKAIRKDMEQMNRQIERSFAKPLENRLKDSVDGRLSSIYMRAHGSAGNAAGKDVIRRRAARAAAAAARGSKAGKRAQEIYGNQLAQMPGGKLKKKAANNIVPGRGSKPKKKRGKRGKRKK